MGKILIKNCNVGEVDIPLKLANKLYNDLKVRHPNAFYLTTRMRNLRNWDGYVKFLSAKGQFKIGLLPRICNLLKAYGYEDFKVIDLRQPVPIITKSITKIGKYKLRPEQIQAVEAVLHNKVEGLPFHIGVIDYSVNAGKSIIMSALYLSFKRKLKTLLITNDADWLNQSREEFKQYLPGEEITFVQGAGIKDWANFSIGMVQTLSRNIRTYQSELAKIDMVLVDEADLGGSKQYQNVLTHLYNTRVRIGLSGTIYMSNKAKDRLKNMNLESFFGPTIAKFTLKQSIEKGYSTNTIVKLVPYSPWFGNWESSQVAYLDIYNETITDNPMAWKMVLDRLQFNLNYGRIPALVVCKLVKHAENLYKYLTEHLKNYRIGLVHVNTLPRFRKRILSDFREGKFDILISTTIIARGKNFPLLRCMINAASMDSQEKSIQFLGRLVRTYQGKNRVYLDDLHYPGNYLDRHGNHRKIYYQKLGIKVIDLSKSHRVTHFFRKRL